MAHDDFAEQRKVLSALVRKEYVDPELADTIGDAIDGWNPEQSEAPELFAANLTRTLQAIAHDKHLAVVYAPTERMPQPPPTDAPRPKTEAHCPPERLPFLQSMKFGVRNIEIDDGIGVVPCDFFPPPYQETRARFDEAMASVKDTRALVIDLRNNRGGHPEMTAYALSYFFERPPFAITHFRGRNWPQGSTMTTRVLGAEVYGEARPMAVAISSATFSGGEEFAYAIQALKRARIVGEASRGGANIGMNYPLPGGFRAFIPVGAPVNAVTGENWEGQGVKPDIEVPAATAIETARDILRECLH